MMRTAIATTAMLMIAGVSVAAPPTPLVCGGGKTTAKPTAITAVDWCSATGVAMMGALVDGKSELHEYEELGQPHDTILTRIASVDYADVDGDRRPEALVVIEQTAWFATRDEPSVSTDVAVYEWRRGAAVRMATLPAGSPVTALSVRRGVVTMTSGPDRAVTRHRWSSRKRAFAALPTAP